MTTEKTTVKLTADNKKEKKNDLVFSYLTLRNLIGFAGMLLPVALAVWPKRPSAYHGFEPSISDYFYTDRGDILVVYLTVIGVFLFTYKGYETFERILTILAGICAIGVAFVPTVKKCTDCVFSVHTDSGGVFDFIAGTAWHFGFAATFLLSLALISLIYFPKTRDKEDLRKANGDLSQKGKRNVMFIICGWIMIGAVAALGIYFIAEPDLGSLPVIYIGETIAVEAFGLSWLTKGETLWPDGKHYIITAVQQIKAFK
jgi:hypothetical protein